MKIDCLLENLKNSILTAERVTGKNQTLPILSSVFITADKDQIKVRSTNLEIALELYISGKIQEPGSVVVPAKSFGLFLSNISGDNVSIETKKNNIYIKTKTTDTTILGYPQEDFPLFPKIDVVSKFSVSCAEIKYAISSVILAASQSETKPELSSIFFNIFKNTIKIVATDSFRLAEKTITSKNIYSEKQILFLVPQKTAQEIIKLIDKNINNMEFCVNKNQLVIMIPGAKLISRLTEGNFPDYYQIIPKTFKTTTTVKKTEFLSAIKLASVFSGRLCDVSLSFQPEKNAIFISTNNKESGDHSAYIGASIQGEETKLKFNWKYLLDGVSAINNEYVSFQSNNDQSPLFIKGKGDNSYFYIAMPMRGI